MKFTKINIRNFLTIGEATARLDERGLVLVSGENRDDTSQDSNGAGKSSLADAVSWALFGITARGESGNDVINNKVKRGGASVSLEINDDGTHYRIERTRLKGKGTLEVERKDKGKWHSLTKGTVKLTQELVDKLVGCSADVFCNAIYAGQEKTPDLPGMTDKMLKLLIEEAAGINRLERAYKVSRERLNEATKALSAREGLLITQVDMVERQKDKIDRLVGQWSDWDDERKRELRTLAVNMKTEKEDAEKAQAHFETLKKGAGKISKELDEINERLDSLGSYQKAVRDAEYVVSELRTEARLKGREIEQQDQELRRLKAQHADVEKIVGKACDSCGKPYTQDDIDPKKERIKKDLMDGVARYKRLRAEQDGINERLSNALSDVEKAKAAVPDTTKEIARRDGLTDALNATNEAETDAVNAAKRVREQVARYKKLKGQANPYDDVLGNERDDLKKLEAKRDALKKEIADLEADVQVKRAASQVFGPAGVRAHILDTVTPFLNDRTNHYLSHLTDGNIDAFWSTIDTNAKGEIKEKFAINVESKVGAKTFKGLSGGEKRKARLACAMALQDLVSSRATKPIELFIADEIDHALDESGLERLMGILEEKAEDRGTVLVISHNSLSDWVRQSVTVVKEGGKSHIEGSALA